MSPDHPHPPKSSRQYQPIVSSRLSALFESWTGAPDPSLSGISDRELLESCLVAHSELMRRAKKGSDEATDYVFRLAAYGVQLLTELSKQPSPLLLSISHDTPVWPAWYSPKPSLLEEYRTVWKNLEVGKTCSYNVDSRSKWKVSGDPARKWAFKIVDFVLNVKPNVDGHKTDFPEISVEWTDLWRAPPSKFPILSFPPSGLTARLWLRLKPPEILYAEPHVRDCPLPDLTPEQRARQQKAEHDTRGVKSWMKLRLGSLYENREAVVSGRSIVMAELPFVDSLLDAYRIVRA